MLYIYIYTHIYMCVCVLYIVSYSCIYGLIDLKERIRCLFIVFGVLKEENPC